MNNLEISYIFKESKYWREKYQRNNKRSGLKNIRCFPFCVSEGHRQKGFCGRGVEIKINRPKTKNPLPLYAFGEFKRIDKNKGNVHKHNIKNNNYTEIKINTIIDAEEIKSRCRTRADIYKPWYRGEIVDGEDSRYAETSNFEFNSQKRGWNYSWSASKHTANAKHALFVFVFEQLLDGNFKCVQICQSPSFSLYCRKRPDDAVDTSNPLNNPFHPLYTGKLYYGTNTYKNNGVNTPNATTTTAKRKKPIKSSKKRKLLATETAKNKKIKQEEFLLPTLFHQQQSVYTTFPGSQNVELPPPSLDFFLDLDSAFDFNDNYQNNNPATTNLSNTNFASSNLNKTHSLQSLLQHNFSSGSLLHNTGSTGSLLRIDTSAQMTSSSNSLLTRTSSTMELEQDVNKKIWRLIHVLDMLETILRLDGSAIKLGVPQYQLDEFLKDCFDDDNDMNSNYSNLNSNLNKTSEDGSEVVTNLTNNLNSKFLLSLENIEPLEFNNYNSKTNIDYANNDNNSTTPRSNISSSSKSTTTIEMNQLFQELAIELLNEESMTHAFKMFITVDVNKISNMNNKKATLLRRKHFLDIFNAYIKDFLKQRDLSLQEFDNMLKSNSDNKGDILNQDKIEDHIKRMEQQFKLYSDEDKMKKLSSPVKKEIFILNNNLQFTPASDVTGTWRLDDNVLEALDFFRQKRGLPWLIRKALQMMEKKMIVEHSADQMQIKLGRKLLSSGYISYKLDGKVHQWQATSPIPYARPLTNSYQAWVEKNCIYLIHTYDDDKVRSIRVIKKSVNGSRLEVSIEFQEYKHQKWSTIEMRFGCALRVQEG